MMKLLIVEDKQVDLLFIQKTIKSVNDEVEFLNAGTAEEGIDMLHNHLVDCVLLDLNLPDSNGLELFNRYFSTIPHVPIIILTGEDDDKLGLTLMDIGAQDFLKKEDINTTNLNKAITFAINRIKTENELRELNATKDKFISLMAHDLKNPLSTFVLATDMLEKDFEKFDHEELKEYVSDINKNAHSIFKLLENLLTWSRVQRGRISYNPEIIDLSYIIRNVASLYEKASNDKNINLEVPSVSELKVFSDTNLINTILRNLVNNAIKFTEIGGKVSVIVDDEGDNYRISVKDTGVGMSEEQQNNMFKIDKNNSTLGTNQEVGSGLGLIVCKEFAILLGCDIKVESVQMQGTTFSFTIPKKGAR